MTARSLLDQLRREIKAKRGPGGVAGMAERMRARRQAHDPAHEAKRPATRKDLERRLARHEPGSLAHTMTKRSLFYIDRVFIPGPPGEGGEWVLREPQTGD